MQTYEGETLLAHLRHGAQEAFDYLKKEAESVSPEHARRYATENWPPQRFGIGQDGSISGIVFHVTAWKILTLPMFAENGTMGEIADFEASAKPAIEDYPAVLAWMNEAGEAWNAALNDLPADALSQTRMWGTATVTLLDYIEEMRNHDIQHAAQIEYLKQRLIAESGA